VLPDPAAFQRTRKRRENILLFLLSLTVLVIASGVLWYLLLQPRGRVERQASAPVPPPAVTPNATSSPSPAIKSAASQPPPATPMAPISQPAMPQPSSAPSAASGNQQTAQHPPFGTPATPGAPAVREPEMKTLRGGSFTMGSNDDLTEKPTHQVTVKPFAISQYPVSVRDWNECAAAKGCAFTATGKDDAPVTNVSWSDAKQFIAWLASATGKPYRLPSEAEWEYAARAGTQTKYWWGDQFQSGMADCKNCADIAGTEQPAKVGSFRANPFGLYDMGGGVDQWVEDCWHKNYQGAPADGSAWVEGDCASHVIRSGSWKNDARYVRPSNRESYDTNVRYPTHGFRVALSP